MRRLVLVRHASTAAVAGGALGADEPLDAPGRVAAAALRGALPAADEVLVSPARRARETAAAAGLEPTAVVPKLAECDFGRWSGRALADLSREQPDAVRAWMTDPGAAPHGGESVEQLLARVGGWLALESAGSGTTLAFTHGGVIKAAVVHALGAPPAACWQVDVAPASLTELHAHDGRWTVIGVNCRPDRG